MYDDPLISVIVPIYMIERYVGQCIESLINQTYTNIEIILVDDGSKDKCSEICDLYMSKDNRIKVIHKTNGGLVSARKTGLKYSKGTYITYVDGDDWVGSDFIENLVRAARNSEADIVCAGFTRVLYDKEVVIKDMILPGVYEGEQLRFLWKNMISKPPFYMMGISTYVWNKLFFREVLIDAQFKVDERISNGEDGAVTYPALLKCSRVVVIDDVSYHYRQREDSMLKQKSEYKIEIQKLKYLHDYMLSWCDSQDSELMLREQVMDYILSNVIVRSGGMLKSEHYSTFNDIYYGKDIVVYNAGTFGQQLVNRFQELKCCNIVAWIDDDYWEYRRCGLDVDPVNSITDVSYEYVLVAKVNRGDIIEIVDRLVALGVDNNRILVINVPYDKKQILECIFATCDD